MKAALTLIALPLSAPLLGAGPLPQLADAQASAPQQSATADFSDLAQQNCKDTIRKVREENAQPLIRRDTADPDAPILYHALDHEVDGCDVLLVSRNGDVRDIPQATEGSALLVPAQ